MSEFIGYKQYIKHNEVEPDIKTKICDISNIVTHTKKLNGISTKQYYFDIIVNKTKSISKVKHAYYYNSLEQAQNMHRKVRTKFYDQETKPYLTKLNKNKRLSMEEKEKLLNIINSF